jgi:hypothetical protein
MIVPTLRVGMHPVTLRVTTAEADAERPGGIPTQSVGTIKRGKKMWERVIPPGQRYRIPPSINGDCPVM